MGLAVALEDFRDGQLRGFLDRLVGIDERQVEQRGQPFADARFARAHHADQHHRPVDPVGDRGDLCR